MSTITTKDGTQIYDTDGGSGPLGMVIRPWTATARLPAP